MLGFGPFGQFPLGAEAEDGAAVGATISIEFTLLAGVATATTGDALAPGDIVELDVVLLPGAATGNLSNEIGWFGPPRLPSWYRPAFHIDAIAPGALVELAGALVAGSACGDACVGGRVFIPAELSVIGGRARGDARARGAVMVATIEDFLPFVPEDDDPILDFLEDLLDAA
jgi:hypothetical protein